MDKGSVFYNRSMKSWLQDNRIIMYSRHNEGKFVVTERIIRTLNNKIDKYITSVSKSGYNDKLDNIVNNWYNTYNSTIKNNKTCLCKKSSTYIDYNKEDNKEHPKFGVGDHVTISEYKRLYSEKAWKSFSD